MGLMSCSGHLEASKSRPVAKRNLAAKISSLVVYLKRLMVRPIPGGGLLRQLRNSRPDNDAKTNL
jgi:hypothetical protein